MKVLAHGKTIGNFESNIFTKKVKGSKHLLRIGDAWGIDSEFFGMTLLPRNSLIKITDTETGITYEAQAQTIKNKGFYRDFGFGRQIFLKRSEWETNENSQPVKKDSGQSILAVDSGEGQRDLFHLRA